MLGGFGLLALATASLQTPKAALAALGLALVLLLFSRLPLGRTLKRLALVNGFLLFIALFLLLGTPGETLVGRGAVQVSVQGVVRAGVMLLKGNALMTLALAILLPLGPVRLGKAAAGLGLGDRFAWLLLLAWRSLHTLSLRLSQLLTAAKLRGFRPGSNLHTYRAVANLTGELFLGSLRQGDRVWEALSLRGYNGAFVALHGAQEGRWHFFWIAAAAAALLIALEVL